ncbi:hypothetical protein BST97_07585 [Nonlabens spongiae]|uniref:Trimeric autotransporter adhesin YadA-like head domain-containing protein n=1 Tax=Nonlabens spongiae TaxID=331648 RepID=A0A1W6MJW5_9FLAO|nr:hypothetical protein [Nonlabens spongiae]ARN77873.1 hypothetical protein BST97_07585 [Nonlabens spongiae]
MKKLVLAVFLLVAVFSQAQVGINTEDPRALLDIKAANEVVATNTPGVMVVGDGLLVSRVSTLLVDGDFPIEGVVVYLTSSFEDTSQAPSVTYEPGFYVSYSGRWETFGTGGDSGELKEFTEGITKGYRLADSDPANHGDVGLFATDLSFQQSASTSRGATGDASFVANVDNTASGTASSSFGIENDISGTASSGFGQLNTVSGNLSFAAGSENNITTDGSIAFGASNAVSGVAAAALGADNEARGAASIAAGEGNIANASGEIAVGQFNTDYSPAGDSTDRVFTVGNGSSDASRSDALIILKNGVITAPSFSNTELGNADSQALITKGYFDLNNSNGQLVEQTNGSNLGYRIAGNNPSNFLGIGRFAINLGFRVAVWRSNIDNQYGASGRYAFSVGGNNLASGVSSVTLGATSVASGSASVALGGGLVARAYGETATGSWNTDYSPVAGASGRALSDRVFVVGNGVNETDRSDALIVRRDGLITVPDLSISLIENGGSKVLTTKEYNEENFIGRLESGDTASRPTGASAPAYGTMRYNTETGRPEVYVENSTNLPTGSSYVPGWISL